MNKVTVKMIKTACGPAGSLQAGSEYDIDEGLATQLVEGDACEIVANRSDVVEPPSNEVPEETLVEVDTKEVDTPPQSRKQKKFDPRGAK